MSANSFAEVVLNSSISVKLFRNAFGKPPHARLQRLDVEEHRTTHRSGRLRICEAAQVAMEQAESPDLARTLSEHQLATDYIVKIDYYAWNAPIPLVLRLSLMKGEKVVVAEVKKGRVGLDLTMRGFPLF